MTFLENLSNKAKTLSETTSLNGIIKTEERKIASHYQILGQLYFEKYGNSPETEFAESVAVMKQRRKLLKQKLNWKIFKIEINVPTARRNLSQEQDSVLPVDVHYLAVLQLTPVTRLAQSAVQFFRQKLNSAIIAETNWQFRQYSLSQFRRQYLR